MNPKLLRRLLVSVVVVGAFAGLYYYTHAPLLRIRLKDGTEIRVLKVAYGTGANHEHELVRQSQLKLRLLQLLPRRWQSYVDPAFRSTSLRVTSTPAGPIVTKGGIKQLIRFSEPMLTVWWVYDLPPKAGDPLHPVLKGVVTSTSTDTDFLQYYLQPGKPDWLAFHLPPGKPKTFAVHLVLDNQSVDFTVPVPPCAEPELALISPVPEPTPPPSTPFVNHFGRASRLQDASEEGK